MNLKGFKKVHEDNKKAVLRNKHGHSITIAKDKLSKAHLNSLKKLPLHAAGGTGPIDLNDESAVEESAGYTSPFESHYGLNQKQSENIPNYGVSDSKLSGQEISDRDEAIDKAKSMWGGNVAPSDYGAPKRLTNNMPVNEVAGSQATASDATLDMPVVGSQNSQPVEEPVQSNPTPTASPPRQQESAPIQRFQSPPDEIDQRAQLAYDAHTQTMQDLTHEENATKSDLLNGHITPMTYHELMGKGSFGRVGSLFGLLIAGAGSGLTGQPNAVLQMMEKEISNDIEAQKETAHNSQNLYRLNMQNQLQKAQIPHLLASGRLTEAQAKLALKDAEIKAFAVTRMQENLFQLHNLVTQNNKLPVGSIDRKKGDETIALLFNAINNDNFNVKDRAAAAAALMSGQASGGGTEQALAITGNPAMANYNQAHRLGDLKGITNKPVPQNTQEEWKGRSEFDQAVKAYVDFANKNKMNWANLNILDRRTVANKGAALGANVQNLARAASNGGVWKAGEQGFIENTFESHPEKWSASFNAIPKAQQALLDNERAAKNVANQYGLKFAGFGGGSQQKAPQHADGQVLILKNGSKAIMRGGKAYPLSQ